ncbi:DASH complex subunit DAD1 [Elsinoe australis]|uniref:DASH complex subunit DAD1 n=1 Tax=Elsinoe australis TaxID=40998 RepID=A0A4U7APD6_9PEZI|nr:DASH complex subunit DAD1 [Elsinoe australis]
MSTNARAQHGAVGEKSYFEQQREMLVNEIAANMESVLQNINKLNRSLEGVIAVGNEFSQVEGLWSQFENVMARPEDSQKDENIEGVTGNESR